MKKIYALCLITLTAVAYDVLVHRAVPAEAQTVSPPIVNVYRAEGGDITTIRLRSTREKIQGFQCVSGQSGVNPYTPICYVLTQ
ncbi:MAG TPA: hypothetical protein VFY29_13265 [Terriglobia bacterium]|nr:hypothetical protein [Terriglobia bacterium]